jgi:glutathione S-transferase
MVKLFHFPGSCSLAAHIVLEEIGKPYELEKVDLVSGAQNKAGYREVNPKGKVPALLRDDGTLLTELPAILVYLAKTHPELNLLPGDVEGEVRVLEALDYMIATLHMRGFTRIFRASMFTPTTADEPAVQQTGRDIAIEGLKNLSHQLGAKAYLLGDFTLADAMLFVLSFWSVGRAAIALPENLAAHFGRMKARPAVERTLKLEGFA